jgi:Ca2+-binding RTX toxin-like protein
VHRNNPFCAVPVAAEDLEGRTLFAATPVAAQVIDGALHVTGTKKADALFVGLGRTPDLIVVRSGPLAATEVGSFNLADLPDGVIIEAGAGNDRVFVESNIFLPTILLGGAGKDWLVGGWGDDVIDGGPGNDRLMGGGGDDCIDGGAGNDQVYGDGGNDSLCGGAGKDLVTGGTGSDLFDDDLPAEVLDKAADEILTGPIVVVPPDA